MHQTKSKRWCLECWKSCQRLTYKYVELWESWRRHLCNELSIFGCEKKYLLQQIQNRLPIAFPYFHTCQRKINWVNYWNLLTLFWRRAMKKIFSRYINYMQNDKRFKLGKKFNRDSTCIWGSVKVVSLNEKLLIVINLSMDWFFFNIAICITYVLHREIAIHKHLPQK